MTTEPDVIFKTRTDAGPHVAPPPPNKARRRRPLGLAPGGGASDDVVHEADPPASEAGFEDPTVALIVQSNALLVDLIEGQRRHFETKIAKVEARLAEATAKVSELSFISERLRIEARGPAGERGPMGRDGHEGRPGARGERGERGEPGKAAPTITAWAVDADNFTAAPILSDGSNAATLRLRPFFEAYDDAVDASEAAAEIDADRAQRAEVERQAANVRAGLPAR
jgi:hypothetical protein